MHRKYWWLVTTQAIWMNFINGYGWPWLYLGYTENDSGQNYWFVKHIFLHFYFAHSAITFFYTCHVTWVFLLVKNREKNKRGKKERTLVNMSVCMDMSFLSVVFIEIHYLNWLWFGVYFFFLVAGIIWNPTKHFRL